MGFKKTSEGRIYFQSPEDEKPTANPRQKQSSANPQKQPSKKPLKQSNDSFEALFGTPSPDRPSPTLGGGALSGANAQTQMQIITLLKTLNERLKITQAERDKMAGELETYRGLIEDLQAKSAKNETATAALNKKLSEGTGVSPHSEMLARDALAELEETRKLLGELETKTTRADLGVKALKKLQVDQAEKMAVSINQTAMLTKRLKDTESAQEEITLKVDDTIGHQARLSRKIDKAIEERTRFMRKLERIEETVLQTRDSLNAKAMVLLTDQGVAAQTDTDIEAAPQTAQSLPLTATAKTQSAPSFELSKERQTQILQIIGTGLLLVAGFYLGGQFLNEVKAPSGQQAIQPTTQTSNGAPAETQNTTVSDIASMEWSVESDTSQFSDPSSVAATTNLPQVDPLSDDIGTLDLNNQQQVEALLDGNPDALASALNTIEPANPMPDTIVPPTETAAVETTTDPVAETAIEPAAGQQEPETQQPQQSADATPTPAPEPTAAAPTSADPNTLIKADAALPEAVKAIEAQAFNGVPEAQHDLAAIYTAGHGGVRQNYERAAFWFEQAAAGGVANASYNLGVLNHQGLGIDENLEQAISWYQLAASQGHPEAQYNLGIAYIEGIGVSYNAEKAAQYFESAANNNITEAAYNLGLIYENGLLGTAEPEKALAWYKTAADQGSPEAGQALQQLARNLGVSVDEINRLAEEVQTPVKKSEASPQSASQSVVTQTAAIEPSSGVEGEAGVQSSPLSIRRSAYEAAAAAEAQALQNAISSEQIITAQIQEYLMRLALYPGPADGITGPLTQDAIRSYQRFHNLQIDGKATKDVLSHMLSNAPEDVRVEVGSR